MTSTTLAIEPGAITERRGFILTRLGNRQVAVTNRPGTTPFVWAVFDNVALATTYIDSL